MLQNFKGPQQISQPGIPAKGLRMWRNLTLEVRGFDYRTSRITGLGKQALGEHTNKILCIRTQEKGAVSPPETEPDLPITVLPRGKAHWIQQSSELRHTGMIPFKGGCHYCHYLCQTTGKEHSPTLQQKNGLKIYWWPHQSELDSQPLPSGSFQKPLILIHQRADRMKTTLAEI